MYGSSYRNKLTTPEKAVARVKEGSLLIYGALLAEPPALLKAFAERLRANDLKKLRILSRLPLAHAQKTVLAPDLVDHVERCSTFVGTGAWCMWGSTTTCPIMPYVELNIKYGLG